MIWSKIKKAINSTLGTSGFKPLDKIITDSFGEVVGKQNAMKTALESGENNFIVEFAKSSSNIEVGSYVGTGTYGQNNKTVLSFGFEPKIVFISSSDRSRGCGEIALYRGNSVAHFLMATTNDGTTDEPVWRSAHVSWNGNTVSLYYNDPYCGTEVQQNMINTSYYYVAIG